MDDVHVVWDLEDDPDGNVQHIQEHGITMDEVEDVLFDRDRELPREGNADDRTTPHSSTPQTDSGSGVEGTDQTRTASTGAAESQ